MQIEEIEEAKMDVDAQPSSFTSQAKMTLRGHVDVVTGTQFIDSMNLMASCSEDATIKLWDLNLMIKNHEEGFAAGTEFDEDYYFTLRGH